MLLPKIVVSKSRCSYNQHANGSNITTQVSACVVITLLASSVNTPVLAPYRTAPAVTDPLPHHNNTAASLLLPTC